MEGRFKMDFDYLVQDGELIIGSFCKFIDAYNFVKYVPNRNYTIHPQTNFAREWAIRNVDETYRERIVL
jgi:hypothetical protein